MMSAPESVGPVADRNESPAGPFHFASEAGPLHGVFHVALDPSPPRGSLLVVPPIGSDAIRQHRAMRQLATAASRAGFDVLRFDFRGHGDSAGDSKDFGLADWIADVRAARAVCDRRRPGAPLSVAAFGAGALAAHAALSGETVDLFAAIDAPRSGAGFWNELEESHRRNARATAARWHDDPPDGPFDRLGFEFGAAARASLVAGSYAGAGPVAARRVVASTAPEASSVDLGVARPAPTSLHHPWPAGLDEDPFKPRVPQSLIQALVALLAGRAG